MERIIKKSKKFTEADAWDVFQQTRMKIEERQKAAKELKRRVYGEKVLDVREAHITHAKLQSRKEKTVTGNEIVKIVVDAAYHIHRRLGPCLFESVYGVILAYALNSRVVKLERQAPVPIVFDGIFRVANGL